jgi:Rrf2 family transcriptional regulator, cysteine metabolism repressor
MRLTRTNVYALRASLQLVDAPRGLPIPCSRLAQDGNMPERFLLQVLRVLVKHQVLKSTCGVAGGYYLARAPQRISLRDLFRPFDDAPQRAGRMLYGVSEPVRSRLIERLSGAEEAGWRQLQNISLAEIARGFTPVTSPLSSTHAQGTRQAVNILLSSLAFAEVVPTSGIVQVVR